MSKRLVLFGEGEGDEAALPCLVSRLINEREASDVLYVDSKVFKARSLGNLLKKDGANWKRWLLAAQKRSKIVNSIRCKDLGGVILILDGDDKDNFCAKTQAVKLATMAREVGAGEHFSVAVVFAVKEYESWLIAGAKSFIGKPIGDELCADDTLELYDENRNLEDAPRDAKGWLKDNLLCGYKPAIHQVKLTTLLDLDEVRQREMRSFQRLESAIEEVVEGCRSGNHVATP